MKDLNRFLREFNKAWANQDHDIVLSGVTDDISFRMANSPQAVKGKAAFADWLQSMDCGDDKATIRVDRLVADGNGAALTGDIRFPGKNAGQHYVFCDLYTLRGEQISEITAYCVKVGEGMGME